MDRGTVELRLSDGVRDAAVVEVVAVMVALLLLLLPDADGDDAVTVTILVAVTSDVDVEVHSSLHMLELPAPPVPVGWARPVELLLHHGYGSRVLVTVWVMVEPWPSVVVTVVVTVRAGRPGQGLPLGRESPRGEPGVMVTVSTYVSGASLLLGYGVVLSPPGPPGPWGSRVCVSVMVMTETGTPVGEPVPVIVSVTLTVVTGGATVSVVVSVTVTRVVG